MNTSFPTGKLPARDLIRLLEKVKRSDPRLIVGPQLGEDAAVIDIGDRYLVAKSDPITFVAENIGWYVVNVNANDVACTGAVPKWFLTTVLLPAGSADSHMVETIFDQIIEACDQLGVTLAGGHTEITFGIDRPLVIGHMLAETTGADLITTSGVEVGDDIIITKGIAVEATALIAQEKEEQLAGAFPAAYVQQCKDFLRNPGISVVRDAQVAVSAGRVHAMHDPTEGGLATGLWEMSMAAGVGLEIEEAAIPIFPETAALCSYFSLDPLGVIASGSLLIACPASATGSICRALEGEDIACAGIGRAVESQQGCHLLAAGDRRPMPTFARDEIARLFE
jgi:hydrogenase expression/formation protein HypE